MAGLLKSYDNNQYFDISKFKCHKTTVDSHSFNTIGIKDLYQYIKTTDMSRINLDILQQLLRWYLEKAEF